VDGEGPFFRPENDYFFTRFGPPQDVGTPQNFSSRNTKHLRAFVEQWVTRPQFKAAFDSLSNEQFVARLYANAGVEAGAEDLELVRALNEGRETRAGVVRRVAEQPEFVKREFNPAFVLMQYFGYLRRDPDQEGFNFWLAKLEQFGGNFQNAEMVKAFIDSAEYKGRFGS
jgi:hypothetical protein